MYNVCYDFNDTEDGRPPIGLGVFNQCISSIDSSKIDMFGFAKNNVLFCGCINGINNTQGAFAYYNITGNGGLNTTLVLNSTKLNVPIQTLLGQYILGFGSLNLIQKFILGTQYMIVKTKDVLDFFDIYAEIYTYGYRRNGIPLYNTSEQVFSFYYDVVVNYLKQIRINYIQGTYYNKLGIFLNNTCYNIPPDYRQDILNQLVNTGIIISGEKNTFCF
jgi:hypothetical protein